MVAGLVCLAAVYELRVQTPPPPTPAAMVSRPPPRVTPPPTVPAPPPQAAAEPSSTPTSEPQHAAASAGITSVSMSSRARPEPSAVAPGWPPADSAAFLERFRGAELAARWHVSNGWSNGDWFSSEWRSSQVGMRSDGIALTMAANTNADATKPYMSAELRSDDWYRYGYFASRLRAPHGGGLVAAFFTFTSPISENGQNEIDMEITGQTTSQIELTYHVNGNHIREIVPLGFDASAALHTYAFEWRPESIRWYIDNRLVHVSRAHVAELDRPQQIFVSLWNSARMPRWLGPIDPAAAPWVMTVSCVAYAPQYNGHALC